MIKSLEVQGHNYLKDTVAESFKIKNGKASWESNSETGQTESKNAFYIGINSTPGSWELLVRKLLEANSVDLYPNGNTKLTSVSDHSIGDTLQLKLVEFVGISFEPSYVWFDEDNRFFASPSSWLTTIRKGYESIGSHLYKLQTAKQKENYKRIADELTTQPKGKLVIKNVNVFNSEDGSMMENKTVIVNGNTIEQVTDDADVEENAMIIDGSGKTLMPGLFDMHGHLSRSDGILNLAGGVTSVRDMANNFELPTVRDEFNKNTVLGPRILIMSGFIDQAGPYAGPTGKIVKSLEEGLEAIQFYHDRGYQQIKLYSSIDPSWVKPMAEKTHELGMRLSGHIPSYMIAEQAINDGYDEIQHINMIALNFLGDTIDTRTPLRFSMPGKYAHQIDIEGEEFQKLVKLLKEKDIVIDPTVSIFEGMLTSKAGEPNPSFDTILDRLPIQVKRAFYSGGLPMTDEERPVYKKSYEHMLKMVKALHDAGIRLVAGTDSMVGFGLHKELENYVRAGISVGDVLQIATVNAANITGNDNLGVIKEGYLADMIIIDGNPLEDISNIRRIETTIKDGKVYDCSKLYEAVGVAHFK
ncbi:amidohydrolase family protein [Mangrovivirga cuniculi]|uniref:Amidohydrolase n=1 Tax=Mangrovivirga cuniculi TaxID=2715131 RepID=A0A4D7K8I7_9BACT|nr:amidohydrolase family protein [Mangrovivirga cuniculi]QCK15588.1 amidohydrolase [Mangrovivirga cuniculi]